MSSGFVTETEALDIRKKRQEEWEKVRSASDPIDRPEEPYDNRCLYDKLQEQKQKKDLEYEEAHKLKNMIKGLDDDEVDFLDLVDRTKLAADRIKTQEEEKELTDYRNRVATLQEKAMDQKLATSAAVVKPKTTALPKRSQITLLQGAVVKKSPNEKKRKLEESADASDESKKAKDTNNTSEGQMSQNGSASSEILSIPKTFTQVNPLNTGLQCVGILPGLGYYENSSSDTSESDSDSDDNCCGNQVKLDLLGRKIVHKQDEED